MSSTDIITPKDAEVISELNLSPVKELVSFFVDVSVSSMILLVSPALSVISSDAIAVSGSS